MTENNFNFTNGVSYDVWYESKRLIDQLKKENEELKKNNQILCDLYKNVDSCLQKRTEKFDRYRKALDEIERICLEDVYIFADGTKLRYDSLDDILDIINKLKGGNDE